MTERISVAADGTQGNGPSFVSVISRNGRYVAFMSQTTNLVPGPVPPWGLHSTYLRDRQTGTVERVVSQGHPADVHDFSASGNLMLIKAHGGIHVRDLSTGHTQRVDLGLGEFTGGSPQFPRISGSGRYVVFIQSRPQGSTAAEASRIYVRDLQASTTQWVSHPNTSTETYYAGSPVISDDGQRIAYTSFRYLPEGTSKGHAYLLDRSTGERQMVDVSQNGPTPERTIRGLSLSADGGLVLFNRSDGSQVTADDQYSRSFIRNLATGITRPIPATGPQTGAGNGSLSADGRFALYEVGFPASPGPWQLHIRNLETGEVESVSTAMDGGPASDHSTPGWVSITGDGRTVAFVSGATNLVPGDTNAAPDIFVRTLPPTS
ncbi:TolB family protein [Streptomyces qinzhouensis]|uniref:TolB family protein n=1 Tax=Streptomyces qinzhouensis TaxID=2599401 RepID=UPI0016459D5F|nr:PD40 domain-containing protein [Streptomyces qinzhouensis]